MPKSKRKTTKRKPVTLSDVLDCAKVLSALYHEHKEICELHQKQYPSRDNLLDKTDYELELLKRIGLFQAVWIELLDIVQMMSLAKRIEK